MGLKEAWMVRARGKGGHRRWERKINDIWFSSYSPTRHWFFALVGHLPHSWYMNQNIILSQYMKIDMLAYQLSDICDSVRTRSGQEELVCWSIAGQVAC